MLRNSYLINYFSEHLSADESEYNRFRIDTFGYQYPVYDKRNNVCIIQIISIDKSDSRYS
jgi:hypothetical protein